VQEVGTVLGNEPLVKPPPLGGGGALTVNERLFVAGLLQEFDRAGRDRDREAMIRLLDRARVTKEDAEQSVDRILGRNR